MRIDLINMPFSSLYVPSIAITQLKTVIEDRFGDQVDVNLHYFNHEIGTYLDPFIYTFISESGRSHDSGFGEWLFRQEAFPDLEDNTEEYFGRYGVSLREENLSLYESVLKAKRDNLGGFLDELISDHGLDRAHIVGFTSMFAQNLPSFALARKLKQVNPQIVTVIGGANCESPMGEEIAKNIESIDYVFSGTALKSFPRFIENHLEKQPEKCNRINGVFSKENCENIVPAKPLGEADSETNIVKVGSRGDELNINEVVELNYDSFLESYDRYFKYTGHKPHLLFETSRGCWWGEKAHCTFCGLNGATMAFRAMSSEKAIIYLNSIFSRYSTRVNDYSCVDNILPTQYLKEVFPYLDVPKDFSIFYEVKTDLKEADMKVLAGARINKVQPGIEALATSTLKLMKKGTTSFTNIKFLKSCNLNEIFPTWNLLIGFPGELEEVYEKYYRDISSLYHLPAPSGVFPVRFDRYSPYFNQAKEYGLDLHPLDYHELIFPPSYTSESLANIAYYFSDNNYDNKYIKTTAKWLHKLESAVDLWSDRWYTKDNLVAPQLYFLNGNENNVVYDSRSGVINKYELTSTAKKILDQLIKPVHKLNLFTLLPEVNEQEMETELESLIDNKLIFQEGQRMMSLVCESEVIFENISSGSFTPSLEKLQD